MRRDEPDFKLIRAARLIDGTGAPTVERGAVLVEGDRISAAGPEESVVPPEGADVTEISYDDKTVLPGLVDCHVHLIGIGDGRAGDELVTLPDEILTLQAARNAREHLYSGVTTVRDLGAKNRTTLLLRQAVDMGITPSPRLVLAGRPIAIIGGHLSYFGIEATGTTECRAAVRQLVKEGVDMIKITASGGSTRTSIGPRPSFNVDELTAICDEAHKFGKHVAAHCVNSLAMEYSLEAGVDTLIHAVHNDPDGTPNYRPDITERIARQGVSVNPTLHQAREHLWQLEEKLNADGLTPQEQQQLDEGRWNQEGRWEHVSRMREEGVTLVCGSDAAWANYKVGRFQGEVDAHVGVGMSPMEAIVSATLDSAKSCWNDDAVGSLESGKQADILVVDGDPSQDVNALWNVTDVYLGGELVDRRNLV